MDSDRLKWNQKHNTSHPDKPVSDLVRKHHHLAPPGPVLDLACGRGRNSLFLAKQGRRVDAVDISDVALASIRHVRIKTHALDLDHYQIPALTYSLIVNILFLDRNLFPGIRQGLQPGGLLIFETFLQESDHVSNARYKLRPGELRTAFADFETLFQCEKDGVASLVARKPNPAEAPRT